MKYPAFSLIFLALASPLISHGAVITTSAGDGADSFVEFGTDINDTFGSDGFIRVRLHPANGTDDNARFTRRSVIRFDLSSITETPVTSGDVNLELTFDGGFDPIGNPPEFPNATFPVTFDLYGITNGVAADASPVSTGWVESTVAGSNAPGGSNSTSLNGDATGLLASVTINSTASANDSIAFTSAALTNFILSDTNDLVTFIIMTDDPTTGNGPSGGAIAQFWSKEGTGTAPTLTIIPEPGVYAVLVGAIVGLLAWRRRR